MALFVAISAGAIGVLTTHPAHHDGSGGPSSTIALAAVSTKAASAQPAPASSPHDTATTLPPITLGPGAPGPPAPTGGNGPTTGTGGSAPGGPGLFDITGHIEAAINAWFSDLVTSALNPVLDLLGNTLLATPDVTSQSRVGGLWSSMQAIADSLLILFVLAGGAIVMGHETLQTKTAAKDIAPRLVVAAITANVSLSLAGSAIGFSNSVSSTVMGQGADSQSAATVLKQLVIGAIASGGIFLVLLGLVVAVLGVVLIGTFIVRLALVIILVVAAPLALVCHALPQTEAMAQLWWRAFAGCLLTQIGQSLVLVTAIRVFLGSGGGTNLGLASSSGMVDLLIAASLCWVLIRIPSWVGRFVFSGNRRHSSTGRMVRNIVIYKGIKALTAAVA